jgi:peptide/nickel transport system substrate-binding protein
MTAIISSIRASALFVALLLAACGRGTGESEVTGTATSAPLRSSEPRYGGNLILGVADAPSTLNMLYIQDIPSFIVASLISDGLMETNERFELQPRIAAAPPEISPEGTVWTYRLREGVRFHDGMPLTAHDVAFTYELFLHPDFRSPWRAQLRSLASVEAVDDQTVRFTLREPDANFEIYTIIGIQPRHLLERVPVADLGDYRAFNVDRPIGAGPFRFGRWTAGENLVLEAFEDYHGGRPYVDRVTFRFMPNASARVLALEAGEIHYTTVPPAEVATVRSMPHAVLHDALTLNYSYLAWNLRNPLFTDRRVRQALTHAIDRQEIVDTILEGHAVVAHSPVSPVIAWAYADDVPRFDYDPERAKALLREAGWTPGSDGTLTKDGIPFAFELLSAEGNADVQAVVQQALRQVGIDARLTQLEWGAVQQRIRPPNSDFDALYLGWQLQENADPSPQWHSRSMTQGANLVGFSDARVDELIDRSATLLDREERGAVLKEVWRILAEEQAFTFLYHPRQFVAVTSGVRGYVQNVSRQTYGLERWWLDRD